MICLRAGMEDGPGIQVRGQIMLVFFPCGMTDEGRGKGKKKN